MATTEALKGIDIILLFRLLEDKKKNVGTKLTPALSNYILTYSRLKNKPIKTGYEKSYLKFHRLPKY